MRIDEVHGFNYDGSWGSSGLDLWVHHQNGTMASEVGRGKRYFPEWNVARWWLSDEGFQRQPDAFVANFDAGLAIFAAQDIAVIPVLFNRWRDPICDFGGVSLDHIIPEVSNRIGQREPFEQFDGSLLEPYSIEWLHFQYLSRVVGGFADDSRVLVWDLCNEPLMGPYIEDAESPVRRGELQWLTWCYEVCKRLGAKQPLTVGNFPNLRALELTLRHQRRDLISSILSLEPSL